MTMKHFYTIYTVHHHSPPPLSFDHISSFFSLLPYIQHLFATLTLRGPLANQQAWLLVGVAVGRTLLPGRLHRLNVTLIT